MQTAEAQVIRLIGYEDGEDEPETPAGLIGSAHQNFSSTLWFADPYSYCDLIDLFVFVVAQLPKFLG